MAIGITETVEKGRALAMQALRGKDDDAARYIEIMRVDFDTASGLPCCFHTHGRSKAAFSYFSPDALPSDWNPERYAEQFTGWIARAFEMQFLDRPFDGSIAEVSGQGGDSI